MTRQTAVRTGSSLVERAAAVYDFSSGLLVPPAESPAAVEPPPPPAPRTTGIDRADPRPARPARRSSPRGTVAVDRQRLRSGGFILPESPATGLAEELRLVKRQLLAGASGRTGIAAEKRRRVLVCSGQPDEGKTFCALNLALSLAGEQDLEVLLVDGDFSKPEILSLLGLEAGPGLVDALADPTADAESFVIRTDLGGLSLLPAGRQANNVPELLASERTSEVLAGLTASSPRRLIIFDSPPALMASPASVLAGHVGQALIVVRADKTTESDLKETIGLLSACDHLGLVLNGAGFAARGRRFGLHYGYEP
jgi:exopolysaccharide/PEP-CTERM locus tyrosine autokinase